MDTAITLPDDQRQAILQRIDRAVSHYWQHPSAADRTATTTP